MRNIEMSIYQELVTAVETASQAESRDEAEKTVRLYYAYTQAENMSTKDIMWMMYEGQYAFSKMSDTDFDEFIIDDLECYEFGVSDLGALIVRDM
jgi:uncharacterized protein YeaC (DUF1315 family)